MQADSKIERPVLLVGMMGAGKSTVGRILARRLQWPFIDTDREIELELRRPIAEIFRDFGEARFRCFERDLLCKLLQGRPAVIAAGGGAFINRKVRELSARRATSIWLDAPLEVLSGRVTQTSHRPLLEGGAKDILSSLLEQRRPFYAEAAIHLRCASESPEELADLLLERLEIASIGR